RSLVERPEDLGRVVESVMNDHRQPVLVEEFIAGDELTVGMVGNLPAPSGATRCAVVGVMRVLPVVPTRRLVYSLEVKRDSRRQVRYECPARLPSEVRGRVERAAFAAFQALGCRDVARVDFRLRGGVPYFLEVNPLPGLNPESSDLVILARLAGWTYERLIGAVLDAALARAELRGPSAPCRVAARLAGRARPPTSQL